MTSTPVAPAPAAAARQPRPEALDIRSVGRTRPGTRGRPGTRTENGFIVARDGLQYAGTHLLVDLWGARRLDDIALAEATLREAAEAVGATLLHVHLHHFTPNGGVSGVAVLAESHISLHTWPERGYVALDIFVCGECDPYAAISVLRRAWSPERVQLSECKRGVSA